MTAAIAILTRVWSYLAASGIFWKLIRNYKVLSDNFKVIETVAENMSVSKSLPDSQETQALLTALSNILKTGVIDLPGVDEFKLSANLDQISQTMHLSIEDSKSGKFQTVQIERIQK